MNFVTFHAQNPVFLINCNGIQTTIREGKYPEWVWDISFVTDKVKEEGKLSIEVMKTVEISYSLKNSDQFTVSFVGREGDAFADDRNQYPCEYTFSWVKGNWKIESAERL